ncbi:unnamed protein product [Adineta ricciae]|uniref:Uncharacterized protein n=1 Tax=Adineta ricciae TaxID=249248 RepID=A0A814NED4_ADIRI|nr:unnamed protein product [Adineta ricciae]CAF1091111.1 unnamed protein product [Adineta ricciae]
MSVITNSSLLPTTSQSQQGSSRSLSTAEVAGIVIGCIAGIVLIIILCVCASKWRKKNRDRRSKAPGKSATPSPPLNPNVVVKNELPILKHVTPKLDRHRPLPTPKPSHHPPPTPKPSHHPPPTPKPSHRPLPTPKPSHHPPPTPKPSHHPPPTPKPSHHPPPTPKPSHHPPPTPKPSHHPPRTPNPGDIAPGSEAFPLSDLCPQNLHTQYSKRILRLDKLYFDFAHNLCFCSYCYPSTKPDRFTVAQSIYTVPRGWTRFGLRVDSTVIANRNLFKRWYTAFYGTSSDKVELVMRNLYVPMPGDKLLSGETFSTHLPDKTHVYTSPSIHYASLRHICPTDVVKMNNEWYDVQIVLECKQNPEGIIKQAGYKKNVCQIIPDDQIEWKTDRRASIVPYGLLIRSRKHRCTKKCADLHS